MMNKIRFVACCFSGHDFVGVGETWIQCANPKFKRLRRIMECTDCGHRMLQPTTETKYVRGERQWLN